MGDVNMVNYTRRRHHGNTNTNKEQTKPVVSRDRSGDWTQSHLKNATVWDHLKVCLGLENAL